MIMCYDLTLPLPCRALLLPLPCPCLAPALSLPCPCFAIPWPLPCPCRARAFAAALPCLTLTLPSQQCRKPFYGNHIYNHLKPTKTSLAGTKVFLLAKDWFGDCWIQMVLEIVGFRWFWRLLPSDPFQKARQGQGPGRAKYDKAGAR